MLALVCASAACRRAAEPAQPGLPQISGTTVVHGLTAPVRVVRDRVGVPHIYAANQADLFAAQGFIQAQDRLFQMDLWLRASQGRLSEILGANFIDRDAMTRRIQYMGDRAAEWAAYGPDANAIAEAFVRGINAFVSIARERLPEEFVRAGWPPSYWRADDLLNRTDAFLASGFALDEIRRRKLPDAVGDAVRLIGTAPFLAGAAPSGAASHTRSTSRAEASADHVSASESRAILSAPAARYLVHLVAPGWNVVGATAPWLPGVAIGHNDRLAWAMLPVAVVTEDILIEPSAAVDRGSTQLMRVKGRPQMLAFTRDSTPNGIVLASDREHDRVFVLRWRGLEPGMAAELAAPAIDRAADVDALRDAARRWRMPARRIVFADSNGRVGQVDALPAGRLPTTGAPADASANAGRSGVADAALFAHLLHRFDVGPVPRPADDAPLQLEMNAASWDRSRAISAPGQSGAPASHHFRDTAAVWAGGDLLPLWFSEEAVRANAEATLTLIPAPVR